MPVPFLTAHVPTRPTEHSLPPSQRWAVVSTYPPTQCGIATFTQSLVGGLTLLGATVDVLRMVDEASAHPVDGGTQELVIGGPGLRRATDQLNTADLVVVQHEYGIYGGEDGADLLELMDLIDVPILTVLHTVLAEPTDHQRQVLQRVINASNVLVTMTHTAERRLLDSYQVGTASVFVIPHGAADDLVAAARPVSPSVRRSEPEPAVAPPARPVVLTWGLLGQGKGIEWAIEGMAALRDLHPRPIYVVAGQTHPRVLEREGEAYRRMLEAKVSSLGCDSDVVFHNDFLDAERLHRLVRAADVVLLPYDSREQVTSGVLIEAVAAGRPVVSTRFPHAVELLSQGPGLLVDQGDAQGIADALRRVLTEPGLANRLTARAITLAPSLSWSSVADRYLAAGRTVTQRQDKRAAPWAVVA